MDRDLLVLCAFVGLMWLAIVSAAVYVAGEESRWFAAHCVEVNQERHRTQMIPGKTPIWVRRAERLYRCDDGMERWR